MSFSVSYLVGNSKDDCVKLDLFYTDTFIRPAELYGEIRMASIDDIVAMKMNILPRGGRKKDFWDLHLLRNHYTIEQMLALYEERYPYDVPKEECLK